jgi:hypothetical protein
MPNTDHHRITVREFKEQISALPDDARLVFMADDTRCQLFSIAPSEMPGVEDVFVVQLRLLHNYPSILR